DPRPGGGPADGESVGRAVVDHQDLRTGRERAVQRAEQPSEPGGAVADRDDHRHRAQHAGQPGMRHTGVQQAAGEPPADRTGDRAVLAGQQRPRRRREPQNPRRGATEEGVGGQPLDAGVQADREPAGQFL
ncbi:hypothetical protein CIT14_22170, partial [Virgibacillus profundi]